MLPKKKSFLTKITPTTDCGFLSLLHGSNWSTFAQGMKQKTQGMCTWAFFRMNFIRNGNQEHPKKNKGVTGIDKDEWNNSKAAGDFIYVDPNLTMTQLLHLCQNQAGTHRTHGFSWSTFGLCSGRCFLRLWLLSGKMVMATLKRKLTSAMQALPPKKKRPTSNMPQAKMQGDDSNKKKLQKPTIKTTVKQPTEHPSALRNGHKKIKKRPAPFFLTLAEDQCTGMPMGWNATSCVSSSSGEKSFA